MPQTPNVVLRERLITAVDRRWEGGFGIVLGGPGLGKSTLVRQAMFESATLGRGSEVLVRCRPDWTATSVHASVLAQLLSTDKATSADRPAERAAEFLWSAAPERTGIVFDDLHLLDESGIGYVLELREALPSNAHLLVATRENPLLSALLITADPSFVIDGGELLFTDSEVDDFANETRVDRPALQSAGGWPAVLALTASAGSDVAGAYLYQKVLAGLSRRQQGDLAVAASLGELDVDLASEVLDGGVSDLSAIPLVEITPTGGIIVHDLWREPLSGLVDPARLRGARKAAAAHAEAMGDVDRALSTLVEGGLSTEARQLVLRHIALGADRVPLDRVDRWLRSITSPDQALLRQLLQLLRTGLVAGSLTDLALDEITERCRQANEFDLEAVVCEIKFAASWSADDSDACVAVAERMVELHELGVEAAAPGRFVRDITFARSEGNNARVLELIGEARQVLGAPVGNEWNATLELETLVSLGRPFDALAVLEEAEQRLAERKVRSVTYGLTYWFCGRPDDGLRSLDTILSEPGRFDGLERSWLATSDLFRWYRGIEVPERSMPVDEPDEWFSLYSRVCEGLAQAARLIHAGAEDEAATMIEDLKTRLPPSGGFVLQAWFMGVGMWYVLQPDDRPLLDAFMRENFYGEAGAIFQSLVAGRETGTIPDDLIKAWPTAPQVGVLLPARWAAELALRLPAERSELRGAVLDGLQEKGRRALELIVDGADKDLGELAGIALGDRPHAPGAPVIVSLYGIPQLAVPGQSEAPDWRRGRVRALFGFLAARGRTTREAAIEALWPDLEPQAGRRNLRVTLSYLTRALEPDRVKNAPPWFVRADGEMLVLQTEGMDLDLVRVSNSLAEARLHRASGVASKSIESLRAAIESYGGPFLEGLDDEWIIEERNAGQRQALDACLRLSALLRAGRSEEAVQWARRAVEIDPFSVDAQETLVEALQVGPPHEVDAARERLVQLLDETG